jgi:aminoglycoside/choline kinase family phosphotransferase
LEAGFGDPSFEIEVASSDASFRRYFRVIRGGESWIVMDAPPIEEDVAPFIQVAKLFAETGVNVPEIRLQERERGFLLLGDLGKISYLERLNSEQPDRLYADALSALLKLQLGIKPMNAQLPVYDEALLQREMGLFQEWFLGQLLSIELSASEQLLLEQAQTVLVSSALAQPTVCVHRDYHSRNLMVTEQNNPGIIDFQDAVIGPVTYDVASLLRDCYISWPEERVEGWLKLYHQKLIEAGVVNVKFELFYEWFDLMAVQRHLKAIGIFSRLKLRDGKAGYVADIPRTLNYIRAACRRRELLSALGELIEKQVLPKMGLLKL